MYDIAIIGAGPAGATAARLLSLNHRVLLVDRRQLDREVVGPAGSADAGKPCGGLLSPAAQRELARQGLGVPASTIAGPQLLAVRTVDIPSGLSRLYQRHYINVDRGAFDRWLVSLVPDGVESYFGHSLTGLSRQRDTTVLRFQTSRGVPATARARLVVGADGASSLVRRIAFASEPAATRYVAIQGVFEPAGGEPYYGAIFDESLTDFYGWTIPKGDCVLVGAAFPAQRRSDATTSMQALFDRFVSGARRAGFSFGAERCRHSARIARPMRPTQMLPGDDGVVLLGEAAGFLSPSSGEGVSFALRSGVALARAAAGDLEGAGARYRAGTRPIRLELALRIAKSAAIHTPATRRALMRTGLDVIDRPTYRALPGLAID